MHFRRACVAHQLGRNEEAQAELGRVKGHGIASTTISTHLCLDDAAGARAALLTALDDPQHRPRVLRFVLPAQGVEDPSPYGRWIRDREDALRNDPEVRRAAERHFRILPFALADGAPPEQPGADVSRSGR